MTTQPKHVRPFLKWAGNKYKVLDRIIEFIPLKSNRLIEPFMGSGSLMINRPIVNYLGGDINKDLIDVFAFLKKDGIKFVDEEVRPLFTQEAYGKDGEDHYYACRKEFNETPNRRRKAALFIFLNHHCFNGLCRYNRHGAFTTPYNLGFKAKGKPAEVATERYEHFIEMSQCAKFVPLSFESVMIQAKQGDVVYCDPPYLPQDDKEATFTQYAEGDGFNYKNQQLLATLAEGLASEGVTVIISNHNSRLARKLYAKAKKIVSFDVKRSMGRYEGHANSASEILAVFSG